MVLSTFAVGGAAAARGVAGQLMPWLLLGSAGFLAYAHYLVWVRGFGHRTGRWILVLNTVLVVYFWHGRLHSGLEGLLR